MRRCFWLLLSTTMGFELWLDLRSAPAFDTTKINTAAFDRQLLPSGSEQTTTDDIKSSLYVEPSGKILQGGNVAGASVTVGKADEQGDALALVGSVELLLVETKGGWPMITAENILAAAEGTPTKLAIPTTAASEVNGLAFALERGVDALVVSAPLLLDGDDGVALLEALQIAKAQRLERDAASKADESVSSAEEGVEALIDADLTGVINGGVADRVCLDFTRLLNEGEGCLLGSSAKLLALVLGETAPSGYVPPRPFRVNAGPVHQYVLMAEPPGSTKYLSEVVAGDVVLAVDATTGKSRGVTVGRAKTEPRPMLKIEFSLGGGGDGDEEAGASGQLFLQQAETVRLATETSGALPVTVAATSSAPLPRVRVRATAQGTHVGRVIKARVNER